MHDCLGWATGNKCGECHICVMVEVFSRVRELLADDGTLWGNYGVADSIPGRVEEQGRAVFNIRRTDSHGAPGGGGAVR